MHIFLVEKKTPLAFLPEESRRRNIISFFVLVGSRGYITITLPTRLVIYLSLTRKQKNRKTNDLFVFL